MLSSFKNRKLSSNCYDLSSSMKTKELGKVSSISKFTLYTSSI